MRPAIGETTCIVYVAADTGFDGDDPAHGRRRGDEGEHEGNESGWSAHSRGLLRRGSTGQSRSRWRSLGTFTPPKPSSTSKMVVTVARSDTINVGTSHGERVAPRDHVVAGRDLDPEEQPVDDDLVGRLAVDLDAPARQRLPGDADDARRCRGRHCTTRCSGLRRSTSSAIGAQPAAVGSVHAGAPSRRSTIATPSYRSGSVRNRSAALIVPGDRHGRPRHRVADPRRVLPDGDGPVVGERADPPGDEHGRVAGVVEQDVAHAEAAPSTRG